MCVHVPVCVCEFVCVYVCTCVCVCARVYVCVRVCLCGCSRRSDPLSAKTMRQQLVQLQAVSHSPFFSSSFSSLLLLLLHRLPEGAGSIDSAVASLARSFRRSDAACRWMREKRPPQRQTDRQTRRPDQISWRRMESTEHRAKPHPSHPSPTGEGEAASGQQGTEGGGRLEVGAGQRVTP
eukprot:GHVU01182081.1.p1 GENE.GHVU01182081.1~~GHVU01182081.1.p1  ORF type:complete len:180 (+),score=30.77 GHVU01182081.1:314-853(+)